jgi:hypothetical protein
VVDESKAKREHPNIYYDRVYACQNLCFAGSMELDTYKEMCNLCITGELDGSEKNCNELPDFELYSKKMSMAFVGAKCLQNASDIEDPLIEYAHFWNEKSFSSIESLTSLKKSFAEYGKLKSCLEQGGKDFLKDFEGVLSQRKPANPDWKKRYDFQRSAIEFEKVKFLCAEWRLHNLVKKKCQPGGSWNCSRPDEAEQIFPTKGMELKVASALSSWKEAAEPLKAYSNEQYNKALYGFPKQENLKSFCENLPGVVAEQF